MSEGAKGGEIWHTYIRRRPGYMSTTPCEWYYFFCSGTSLRLMWIPVVVAGLAGKLEICAPTLYSLAGQLYQAS